MIPRETIEAIRERIDIVEVVSRFVNLAQCGSNYKAICPFHKEKTPSFIVSPEKQIFKCFGCGAGGNVFNFLMKIEGLSFIEAVRLLARQVGIQIEEKKISNYQKNLYQMLFSINEKALNYFCENLYSSSNEALTYIIKRGLSKEIIKKFELGYLGFEYDSLFRKLLKTNIDKNLLLKSGLFVKSRTGNFMDRFRGRIIFPIFDINSKVVAFSGRVFKKGDEPKYLNSPDTPIFSKSRILYGLNFAKSYIKEEKFVIIVEGYMDVISLYSKGIKNVVATMGTSLTQEQVALLKRFTDQCIFAYDSDSAGLKAMLRGVGLLSAVDMDVRVASFPDQMDPDEYINTYGVEAFRKKLVESVDIFTYVLNRAIVECGKQTVEQKLRVIKKVQGFILKEKNFVRQNEYIKLVAVELDIKEEVLRQELKRLNASQKARSLNPGLNIIHKLKVKPAESYVVMLMLVNPVYVDKVDEIKIYENISLLEGFQNENLRELAECIIKIRDMGNYEPGEKLFNYIQDEKLLNIAAELLMEESNLTDREKVFDDCVIKIRNQYLKLKIKELLEKIKKLQQAGQTDEIHALQKDYIDCVRILAS